MYAMMRRSLLLGLAVCALAGCSSDHVATKPKPVVQPPPEPPIMQGFIQAYEQKKLAKYEGYFTGDFTFEFSTGTDPTLVQQHSSGWLKSDEAASASHLFNGYTPPGGATLPAATTIDINLAADIPTDDSTSGVDPATHKVLATRLDGAITVPQSGSEPLTYVITNNYNIFYLVRGDVAVNLDSTQPADAMHWYIYHWVDLSEALPKSNGPFTKAQTWASLRAMYR